MKSEIAYSDRERADVLPLFLTGSDGLILNILPDESASGIESPKWNRIVCTGREFADEDILEFDCYKSSPLSGGELPADTLSATVRSTDTLPRLLTTSDNVLLADSSRTLLVAALQDILTKYFTYGDPVLYYHGQQLIGRFYLTSIARTGGITFDLEAVSAIGILDSTEHYGGLYRGERFGAAAREIVGGQFPLAIDAALENVPVYGALPIDTRRNNLHRLLFAYGGAISSELDGTLAVKALSDASRTTISDSRVYDEGSETRRALATAVAVTEYSIAATPTDNKITLYSGDGFAQNIITPKGAAAYGALIKFSNPCHDLALTYGAIVESGVNYAAITGDLSGTLTGYEYTTTAREIIKKSGVENTREKIIRADSSPLVNFLNSENVADRLLAYYANTHDMKGKLVVENERPGDTVRITDTFGSSTNAFIEAMTFSLSRTLAARTEFVANFIPAAVGNFYTQSFLLSKNQTFTVPAGHKGRLLAVLISGGQHGWSGGEGEAGGTPANGSQTPAEGGAGGEGGDGGIGGRIVEVTFNVATGQPFYAVIGMGGDFLEEDGTPGMGTDTYFGGVTTAGGTSRPNGYINLITGEIYALSGNKGLPGGRGAGYSAPGESIIYGGVTYTPGVNGADARYSATIVGYGGYGGGPSVSASGEDGVEGSAYRSGGGNVFADGGGGGAGAPASGVMPAAPTLPGSGGHGGHGGGGGGAGGRGVGGYDPYAGPGGVGGWGGAASVGADGAVIIYI